MQLWVRSIENERERDEKQKCKLWSRCAVDNSDHLGLIEKLHAWTILLSIYSYKYKYIVYNADSFNFIYMIRMEKRVFSKFISLFASRLPHSENLFLFWCRGNHMTYYLRYYDDDDAPCKTESSFRFGEKLCAIILCRWRVDRLRLFD